MYTDGTLSIGSIIEAKVATMLRSWYRVIDTDPPKVGISFRAIG